MAIRSRSDTLPRPISANICLRWRTTQTMSCAVAGRMRISSMPHSHTEYHRFMTRRQLARLTAGAAFLPQKSRAAAKYTGALDGFEDKVDMASFDAVRFTLK